MAETCEVSIDVEALRDHLSVAERKNWTVQGVVEFLLASGFQRYGDNWIAEEISLDALAPEEFEILRWL